MEETKGPSWSDIPLDLAGRILGRLHAHVDRVRFAAVCPQWRAAARQRPPLSPPMPMLLLPDATVYSLPGSEAFHFPGCAGYTDACGNWLVFNGDDGCFLRDPFSNATVTLPALSRDRIRYVGDESVDEAYIESMEMGEWLGREEPTCCKLVFCSPHLVAAIVMLWRAKRIAVCQPGATSWWSVSADNQYPDFVDLAFHQGKLYALTRMDTLFAMDISMDHSTSDPWVSQMLQVINSPPLFIPSPYISLKMTYLVEARGALLVVLRRMQCRYAGVTGLALFELIAGEQNEFEVFEANLGQSQWTKVTLLGDDQVLFVRRRCCKSVCVSRDEMPGNCIFFLENESEDHRWSKVTSSSCSVYSMKDGKVSTPLPTVSWKRGLRDTPFATWLFPQN
ncbi:unnamed protein product [Urochloa decumbens]|uniref:KIB1-4 beta-propeller domain-containing protein n=1 Tax=Urochloa decumbens TaxID=240449 RepID=A0ABC9ATL4_9POAL